MPDSKDLHLAAYAIITLCYIVIAYIYEYKLQQMTDVNWYDIWSPYLYGACVLAYGYLTYEAWTHRKPSETSKGYYY